MIPPPQEAQESDEENLDTVDDFPDEDVETVSNKGPQDVDDETDGSDEDYDEEGDQQEDCGLKQVADLGSGWARIVAAPIRRGRRTILHLCKSTEKDGSRGAITQVVCSRRGKAAPLHLQARKSRWGDLWPC